MRTGLRAAIKRVVGSSGVDKELIRELARDVQTALIRADVDARIVLPVTERLRERSLGEAPPPGLSRKDHIVKILYDELAGMLGDGAAEFSFKPGRTNRVLMLGIQGSGKTTMAAKLGKMLTRQGYSVGAVGADTHRPGALAQLRALCERSSVGVYGEDGAPRGDSAGVVRRGLKHFEESSPDVVIVDTAGRHKEERGLLDEMSEIGAAAEPDLSLLVIDGTIGRRCFSQAEAFHGAVPVGGIAVTKLDSSAKGGGALAASSATGARVMYIGTGERIDDIEQFSPTRFVGRLLGMGDVKAVLDMVRRLESEGSEARLKRIAGGRMNMEDFYSNLEDVGKAGSFRSILENVPGMSGAVSEGQLDQLEGRMGKWRSILQSMNAGEKADPDLFNASRIRRVARGSGRSEHEVKAMLAAYRTTKGVMKSSRGRQLQGTLRRMGLG